MIAIFDDIQLSQDQIVLLLQPETTHRTLFTGDFRRRMCSIIYINVQYGICGAAAANVITEDEACYFM